MKNQQKDWFGKAFAVDSPDMDYSIDSELESVAEMMCGSSCDFDVDKNAKK